MSLNKAAKESAKDGVESLPDGEYIVRMSGAKLNKRIKEGSETYTFTFQGQVADGACDGHTLKWDLFLMHNGEAKHGLKQLIKELEIIGFPANNWVASDALEENLETVQNVIDGVIVKATKKTNISNGKDYHNVNITVRSRNDGKPERFTPEAVETASRSASPF